MATISTDRPINPGQLGVELGRRFVHAVGPYPDGHTVVDAPGVGAGTLTTAINAHVADPSWVDPEFVAPPPTDAERATADLEQIRTKARAVFDGTDTFTAAQVQKVAAAVVLRLTGGR